MFSSSASCTMNWTTSTWSREPCRPSATRSARCCHPCLRYGLSPMSPGRTPVELAQGEGPGYNTLWAVTPWIISSLGRTSLDWGPVFAGIALFSTFSCRASPGHEATPPPPGSDAGLDMARLTKPNAGRSGRATRAGDAPVAFRHFCRIQAVVSSDAQKGLAMSRTTRPSPPGTMPSAPLRQLDVTN